MSIIRKSVLVVLAIFVVIVLSAGVSMLQRYVQETQNAATASDITNTYMSETPFGPKVTTIVPGRTYFFNSHIVRDEDCFVDNNWWFTINYPDGRVVGWNIYGGRGLSHEGEADKAIALDVPKSLIPGHYELSRQMRFQCHEDGGGADAQVSTTFDVL